MGSMFKMPNLHVLSVSNKGRGRSWFQSFKLGSTKVQLGMGEVERINLFRQLGLWDQWNA